MSIIHSVQQNITECHFDYELNIKLSLVMRNPVFFLSYANNKGADNPAHSRSLVSTCVVRSSDSIIPVVAMC